MWQKRFVLKTLSSDRDLVQKAATNVSIVKSKCTKIIGKPKTTHLSEERTVSNASRVSVKHQVIHNRWDFDWLPVNIRTFEFKVKARIRDYRKTFAVAHPAETVCLWPQYFMFLWWFIFRKWSLYYPVSYAQPLTNNVFTKVSFMLIFLTKWHIISANPTFNLLDETG